MMAIWSLGFDNLTVNNADEDNWGSDGDEVYLAIIGFRAKLGVAGSARSWLNEWRNRTWAEGVSQNNQRGIPAPVGRMVFTNVQDFGIEAFAKSRGEPNNPAFRPEVLGIVSLAFEHDSTTLSTMSGIMNNALNAINAEVDKIIAKETTPIDKLTAAQLSDKLAASAKNIKDAITPSLLEGLLIALKSKGDPDDFISYNISWFTDLNASMVACIQDMKEAKDAAKGKPRPSDRSEAALIARSGLNPLRPLPLANTYQKPGVKYTMSGSVKKTD